MANENSEYRVVVFGAGRVGKSSLVLRFLKDTFRESYVPTVEDFYCQVSHSISSFWKIGKMERYSFMMVWVKLFFVDRQSIVKICLFDAVWQL